jgi:chromosome partitioning protein
MAYVILHQGFQRSRPVWRCQRWIDQIPAVYQSAVLGQPLDKPFPASGDAHCLASLKYNRSLMSLALEFYKPMFMLRPADGALGAHVAAMQDCYAEYHSLAKKITAGVGISLS